MPTLTFSLGATAAQDFTVTRSTIGTSSVSITNNAGLTNNGTPIAFVTSAGYINAMDQYLATSMTAGQWKLWTAPNYGGVDQLAATGSLSGGVMSITAAPAASIGVGHFVTGSFVAVDTSVTAQLTGPAGGVGTYSVTGSQTLASGALSIGVKLPRTKANFDGASMWANDAAANQNVGDGGGVSVDLVIGFSAHVVNPYDGKVLFRAGGHNAGMDGSVYVASMFSGPQMTYRMLAASGKVRPWVDPQASWLQDNGVPPATVVTTAIGTAGSTSLTVSSATGISAAGDGWIGRNAAIDLGTYVQSIAGSVLTLSKPLVATVVGGSTVTYARGAHTAIESRDGVTMPHACQHYFGNVPMPGSSKVLVSGMYMGGREYSHTIGGGWVIDPSAEGVSSGIIGPLQFAANSTTQNSALNERGFAQIGGSNALGALAASDVTGAMYCAGKGFPDGHATLWRYSNTTTTPSLTKIAADPGYSIAPSQPYVTNAVVCPDPKTGGSARAFFFDLPTLSTNFAVYPDIDGAAGNPYLCTWPTRPTFTAPSTGNRAACFAWNSDRQVMACWTGDRIYEFSLSWDGSTYVSSSWTDVTAASTGDVPTVAHGENNLMRLAYFPAPYRAYVLTNQQHEVRVFRRD